MVTKRNQMLGSDPDYKYIKEIFGLPDQVIRGTIKFDCRDYWKVELEMYANFPEDLNVIKKRFRLVSE